MGHRAVSTCGTQTYWYANAVQMGRVCGRPATATTEALDGSRMQACAEHAADAVRAGARLITPTRQESP